MEIHCVGILVATAFVAVTGGDMDGFERPGDAGPWSGLAPKQDRSGDVDRLCHVTKAGSPLPRRPLVESAQLTMRDCSSDTGLKAKGLGIRAHGGKIARRKAVTAVARSLAVMMAAMSKKPDAPYVPLSERCERELPAMRAMA